LVFKSVTEVLATKLTLAGASHYPRSPAPAVNPEVLMQKPLSCPLSRGQLHKPSSGGCH